MYARDVRTRCTHPMPQWLRPWRMSSLQCANPCPRTRLSCPMLKPPVSISMAFVRGLLQGPLNRGESPERLLEAAGIDPVLLNEASARVTGDQYIALFRAINEALGDDGLGFFSRRLKVGSLALIVRPSLGAPSLEVAMRRMARTFALLQDDAEMTLL